MTPDGTRPPDRGARSHKLFATLFALGAAAVVAVAVALLSFDLPITREHDPETEDAYVGGDAVPVAARVQGYLTALPIVDNQVVHEGDPMAQVEQGDYRSQVDQACAQLAAAEAQVASLTAQQAQLTAQIGQARTQQASQQAATVRTAPELRRQEQLISTDVGLRRSLEQAQADQRRSVAGIESAQATMAVRQREFDTLAAQRAQAEATVRERRAALALPEINLGWTTIRAPADGTLGPRQVRVGDLVQPGGTIAVLTPLDTVWVDANFTERQITLIQPGQFAQLRVDAFPGQPLDGHVVGLSPLTGSQLAVIPADNATGNFTKVVQRIGVRIAVDWNGSPLRGLVRPGMSVTAAVRTGAGP